MIDRERVSREMTEAAEAEHPWIPGARADLIRDAARLLAEPVDLAELFANEPDLDRVRAALVREHAVRYVMAETGEDRQTVTDMIDAMDTVDQEAVLELTEGHPTTLRDALGRYVDQLPQEVTTMTGEVSDRIAADLTTLLNYPWPEEEATISTHGENASVRLTVERPDGDHLTVSVGGREVETVYSADTRSVFTLAEHVATAVHRALLARVIGDREHIVQLNDRERRALLAFAERPGGSWRPEGAESGRRLNVEAVEGGGLLIRTQPYRYVSPPSTR